MYKRLEVQVSVQHLSDSRHSPCVCSLQSPFLCCLSCSRTPWTRWSLDTLRSSSRICGRQLRLVELQPNDKFGCSMHDKVRVPSDLSPLLHGWSRAMQMRTMFPYIHPREGSGSWAVPSQIICWQQPGLVWRAHPTVCIDRLRSERCVLPYQTYEQPFFCTRLG